MVYLPVLGDTRVALPHGDLNLDGKGDRIDDAAEFHQRAIAHELDCSAVMLCRFGLDQLLAVALERGQRPRLVVPHEAAVANHVGSQDCSKLATGVLGHS